MSGYTKLFSSILDSTVWSLSKEARLLWITMLVKKNRAQVVEAAIPGLANAARLTVPETESALKELLAPDSYSRTKEHDGRRIEEVPGGWLVLNGAKYRDMMSKEERKEYQRLWAQEKRDREKANPKKKFKKPGGNPEPAEALYEKGCKNGDGKLMAAAEGMAGGKADRLVRQENAAADNESPA
jgi:hypothetical protein